MKAEFEYHPVSVRYHDDRRCVYPRQFDIVLVDSDSLLCMDLDDLDEYRHPYFATRAAEASWVLEDVLPHSVLSGWFSGYYRVTASQTEGSAESIVVSPHTRVLDVLSAIGDQWHISVDLEGEG